MTITRTIIAGAALAASLDAEREALVAKTAGGFFNSEQLCELQRKRSARGICEVEIVKSIYGYSVRYASGLHNFGVLRGARGAADPSFAAAKQFCCDWVAADPDRRFATTTEQEAA
jgi:hypothetical protein